MADGGAAPRRAAHLLVRGYAMLTAWGIMGFFLMGRVVPGIDPELQRRSMVWGMLYVGPLTICCGFAASACVLAAAVGWRRTLWSVVAIVGATLALELVGARTGIPFGQHGYGPELGWRVLGLIPAVIPLSWFMMLVACAGLVLRLGQRPWPFVLLVTAAMLAWDVLMEPAMSRAYPFWHWRSSGMWYGMPLANWLTWLVWVPIIATMLRRIAGPGLAGLASESTPTWLYIVTGITPFVLAIRFGLWGAVAVGGGLMLAFLALALFRAVPGRRAAGAAEVA